MSLFRKRSGSAPAEVAQGLEKLFANVSDRALARDVVRFVVEGSPRDVLSRVTRGQMNEVAFLLGPSNMAQFGAADLRRGLRSVYECWTRLDVEVQVRWAQLLDAAQSTGHGRWGYSMPPVGGHEWVELVLGHLAAGYLPDTRNGARVVEARLPFAVADLEPALEGTGTSVRDLVEAGISLARFSRYAGGRARDALRLMPGFGEALRAHGDVVRRVLSGDVDTRVAVMTMVTDLPDGPPTWLAADVAEQATASSAQVRDAAAPVLAAVGEAAAPALRGLARDAKPDQRGRALGALWDLGGEHRAWAEETAATDRAASVRSLLDAWAATAAQPAEDPSMSFELPARSPVVWNPLSEADVRVLVDRIVPTMERATEAHNASMRALAQRAPGRRSAREATLPRSLRGDLVRALTDPAPGLPDAMVPLHLAHPGLTAETLDPQLPLPVAVRLLSAVGAFGPDHSGRLTYHAVQLFETRRDAGDDIDALRIQWLLDDAGLDGARMVWRSLTSSWNSLGSMWPADALWPFLAANLDVVIDHARPVQNDWYTDDKAFFRLVATFPQQPRAVTERLFEVALGTGKTNRREAQDALATNPERTDRAAAALADGRGEVRTVAASWLARIADPAALPALEKAVRREKQDGPKAAMVDALAALGRPAEDYLDLDGLLADAQRTATKGYPAALAWMPWERLPVVRWDASGAEVPVVLVRHLVAQSVRAKTSEPNALLRRYASLMHAEDRHALAEALLQVWLEEDLRPAPVAEAEASARRHAQMVHGWSWGPTAGQSVEQIYASVLPGFLRQPVGSASASRGVLAVVAACGDRSVVAPAERYVKEWYGQRAAQSKALIGMLAWVDDPVAIQVVLAVASRFRTKSIQEEAARQAEALAERRGWGVDELADRTVPTAGFDDDGTLRLEYGEDRWFTARVLPDLTVELRDQTGKGIKSLPAARKSDDPEQVAAAKKALTSARKDLKGVVGLQQARLYDAMCTERDWAAADWLAHFAGHPLMRLLVSRLVWVAERAGDGDEPPVRVATFRLLDDGSLTDADDEPVGLEAGDPALRVRIAHDTSLSAAEVDAWTTHLADYEVEPLFAQLGRGVHAISEQQRREQKLTDFEGHVLSTFALRGRATKLGWTRGPAEDGGWFTTYHKRFPSLGLLAELEFTGNPLPEEDRPCAILSLSFRRAVRTPDGGERTTELKLGDVPAVMLSETWHDVRLIAAEGTGFDPDWKRTTEY